MQNNRNMSFAELNEERVRLEIEEVRREYHIKLAVWFVYLFILALFLFLLNIPTSP